MGAFSRMCVGAAALALLSVGEASSLRLRLRSSELPVSSLAEDHQGQATFGAWGFDLDGMNRTVTPGDDFFKYANGKWVTNATIPADRTSWGTFMTLADQATAQVRAILANNKTTKQGMLYSSFMDTETVEKLGSEPLQKVLEEVKSIKDKKDFASTTGKSNDGFVPSLFGLWISSDEKDPTKYSVGLGVGGLGLPDRDYYLEASFTEQKDAYKAFVKKMLKLAEWEHPEAAAERIITFEDEVAKLMWKREDMRDSLKTYNPMTVSDLREKAPGFHWPEWLANLGNFGDDTRIIVGPPSAVVAMAALINTTNLQVLKDWSAFHASTSMASLLSKEFVDANFQFYGRTLSGTEEQSPRWKRGVSLVNGNMGDAVGEEYVAKHFPPSSKAQVEALCNDLKNAFEARLQNIDWMESSTREKALEKLRKFEIQVGYPNKFRSYDDVKIDESDLVGNIQRCTAADWAFDKAHLHDKVDRDRWFMTPQEVNAYNMPNFNMVVFPAAILQPPFFDPHADPAVNYGAIGAVIGHEMTHGFDDQGKLYDGNGKLSNWWTDKDAEEFKERSGKYGQQFADFKIGIPEGSSINPALTMGEIIADLGGLTLALDAYRNSSSSGTGMVFKAPLVMPKEFDQEGIRRVFLGFAQVWRAKMREEAVKEQLVTDPHPPHIARTDVPVRNLDSWYEAFNITKGRNYFKPEDRVKIW